MAYADYVLSKRPECYFTLSNSNGNVDLTGNGTTGPTNYTAGVYGPIVPGDLCGTLNSSIFNNSKLSCLTNAGRNNKYSMEIWGKFKINPFYGYQNTAYDIISTNSENKIYVENSFITFLVTGSDGSAYRAQVKYSDWDEPFHIVAEYDIQGIILYVNGVASDYVSIPESLVISQVTTTSLNISTTNMLLSNFAIYSRILGINNVNSNYLAGTNFLDKKSMSLAMGANYYSLSKKQSPILFSKKITSSDFQSGNIRNLKIENNRLKNIEYTSAVTRNSSGSVTGSTTGATGFVVGGISNTNHIKIDAYPALASNEGFIGVNLPLSTGNARDILTISNKNLRKSWTWELNTNSQLIFTINQYTDASDTPTSTGYTYSTTLTSNNTSQKVWFIFDPNGVRVSTWPLTANTFNQYASSDYINEVINIDNSTELIYGADQTYSGIGSSYALTKTWIGGSVPSGWTGNFTDLESTANNNVWYDFSSYSKAAQTQGEFTLTFDIGVTGAFNGSNIEFDLNKDVASSYGSFVQLKYNGGSYNECTNGKYMPSIPYSGVFDSNNYNTGPVSVQVILESTNIEKNVADFSYISMNIYNDNSIGGYESLGNISTTGSAVSFRDSSIMGASNHMRLNTTFSDYGYLTVPAATGNHASIEFMFAYKGIPNSGSVIFSSFSGSNKLNISSSGLVTVSGWPTGTVYLNGYSVGTGATAQTLSPNHVLIVGTTGTTAPLYLNASVTAGGATGYFSSLTGSGGSTTGVQTSYAHLASWPIVLSGATAGTGQTGQVADILSSRLGIVSAKPLPSSVDAFSIIESPTASTGPAVNPRVNVIPWQQIVI